MHFKSILMFLFTKKKNRRRKLKKPKKEKRNIVTENKSSEMFCFVAMAGPAGSQAICAALSFRLMAPR